MKSIIKFINLIFIIVVVILGVICGIFIYNKKINHVAYVGDFTSFVVTGQSMVPTLEPDDFIIIRKQKSYELDDIITYKNEDGGVTTHRIIEMVDESTYKTKGDGNNYTDGYTVSKSDVYGKVIGNIKRLNKLLEFIMKYKYYCLAAVILIPVILKFISD